MKECKTLGEALAEVSRLAEIYLLAGEEFGQIRDGDPKVPRVSNMETVNNILLATRIDSEEYCRIVDKSLKKLIVGDVDGRLSIDHAVVRKRLNVILEMLSNSTP